MLAERLELNSPHGRRVIGILLFQDLAVVPLLILYPAPGQGGEAVARELLIALAKAGLVLFLLLTVGREGKCILDSRSIWIRKSQGSGTRGRERGFRRSEVVAEIIDEQSDRLQPRLHSVTLPPGVRRSGETLREIDLPRLNVEVTPVRWRNIRSLTPDPETRLAEGDVVVVRGMQDDLEVADMYRCGLTKKRARMLRALFRGCEAAQNRLTAPQSGVGFCAVQTPPVWQVPVRAGAPVAPP